MKNTKGSKTMAVKAKVLNKYRAAFYKQRIESFSVENKVAVFDQFFKDVQAAHFELVNMKDKRKRRAEVDRLRQQRGYTRKRRTSLVEYERQKTMSIRKAM